MSYIAALYIGECLFKQHAIPVIKDYVAINTCFSVNMRAVDDFEDFDPSRSMVTANKMLFRINRDYQFIAPNTVRYDFESATGQLRVQHWEVYEILPPEDDDPDEYVNLEKLKVKVKSGANIKKLISTYLER